MNTMLKCLCFLWARGNFKWCEAKWKLFPGQITQNCVLLLNHPACYQSSGQNHAFLIVTGCIGPMDLATCISASLVLKGVQGFLKRHMYGLKYV